VALLVVGLFLMPRWLYTLLLGVLLPVAMLWLIWRGWRNAAYRDNLHQRLALGLPARTDRPLWLHAASVGEVQSLTGLVQRLAANTSTPLLMTIGSPTGFARAQLLFSKLLQPEAGVAPRISLQLAPFDLPGIVRRFLDASRPVAGVFVETELWPNQVAAAQARGIPLMLVSARVSARSTRAYRRFARTMVRAMVRGFAAIGVQSAADAARFVQLGVDPGQVQVTGNLKFDFPLPVDIEARGAVLRDRYFKGRAAWVAGSTHPLEEDICLAAHQSLLVAAPLLILAPRRPERFDEVAVWLAGKGLRVYRHSQGVQAPEPFDVLLVDTLGELLAFYAAADVAFVGGSLVPVGGHNLLEPAALGKPVLTGKYSFNSPEAAALLEEAGALERVYQAEDFAVKLGHLLTDPVEARRRGNVAKAAVAANRGAVDRTLPLVTAMWQANTY
jgi:3-deoxy-D-manno-octulosonic-acid transferase